MCTLHALATLGNAKQIKVSFVIKVESKSSQSQSRVESSRVELSQVESSQVKSSQVKSNRVESSRVKSSQVKLNHLDSLFLLQQIFSKNFTNVQTIFKQTEQNTFRQLLSLD